MAIVTYLLQPLQDLSTQVMYVTPPDCADFEVTSVDHVRLLNR